MSRGRACLVACVAVVCTTAGLNAHVGSPDVFVDGLAGPYRLLVTVRPPHAIPGVADVEILAPAGDVREVRIVPLPLTGPGAQFAPVADVAAPSHDDPRFFVGHLWMMSAGAWQVRATATGNRGRGDLSVPVPTLPQATLAMSPMLRVLLAMFALVLCAGLVAIVSAAAREARLGPGEAVGSRDRRRGRIAGVIAAAIVLAALVLGNRWWGAEASAYDRYVYKPLDGAATFEPGGRARLSLHDPGWLPSRTLDDLIADHDHLMHLFVLSPSLDRFWHLHPDQVSTGEFDVGLPPMPSGRYQLFADIVHATGVSETIAAGLEVPQRPDSHGADLAMDDSEWPGRGQPPAAQPDAVDLGDGSRMVWVREKGPLPAKRLTMLTFRIEDRTGQPARDLELYMGMPGHAVVVRHDLGVFAHIHPSGSAPMAAMEIGRRALGAGSQTPAHVHGAGGLPPEVTFPYGFPGPGDYRLFVQVKRGGRVQTGAFDARVE